MSDDFGWFEDDEEAPPETPEQAAMHQRSIEKAMSKTRRAQPQPKARETSITELVAWDFNTRVMTLSIDGENVFIDAVDSDLRYLKWGLSHRYVVRSAWVSGKVVRQRMHRIILGRVLGRPLTRDEAVDHKDRNPRNNTRSNLRLATPTQNQWNKGMSKTNRLGIKGIRKTRTGYGASLIVDGKCLWLGIFPTIEEARAIYLEAVKKYRGEFGYLDES